MAFKYRAALVGSPRLPPPCSDLRELAIPEVATLTAGNLAKHAASLGQQSPDSSAAHAAYAARRLTRGQRRSVTQSSNFLSNLPEVEQDVHYRFNFVVVGPGRAAEEVAELACNSSAARQLLCSEDSVTPTGPNFGLSRAGVARRCMCEVTSPVCSKAGACHPALTKLSFNPVELGKDVPTCASHLEALGTVIVFVLLIGGSAKHGSFAEQLQKLAQTVERNREQTHAKFRPVRAVILCDESGDGDSGGGAWVSALADFERTHGEAWKFGPLSMLDGNALHGSFAEMATTRISMGLGSESGGSPTWGEKAADEEDIDEEERLGHQKLMEQMDARNVYSASRLSTCTPSRTPSCCSEGWQHPPLFEAESNGSECSGVDLERHQDIFGFEDGEGETTPEGRVEEVAPVPASDERSCALAHSAPRSCRPIYTRV